jgi:hypothetical protein
LRYLFHDHSGIIQHRKLSPLLLLTANSTYAIEMNCFALKTTASKRFQMISFTVLKIILNSIGTNHDCCLAKTERKNEIIFGFSNIR